MRPLREILHQPSEFVKREFWIVSAACGLLRVIGGASLTGLDILIYVILNLLNFLVLPNVLRRKDLKTNALLAFIIFLSACVGLGIITNPTYAVKIGGGFALYSLIKYQALYVLGNWKELGPKHKFWRPEGVSAVAVWLLGTLALIYFGVGPGFLLCWLMMLPSAIFLYLLNFSRLIPLAQSRRSPLFFFIVANLVVLLVMLVVTTLISLTTKFDDHAGVEVSFANAFFQAFVTLPFTWMRFKKQKDDTNLIEGLQKELTQTTASMDFLRSQINPHFIFNALNTVYGLALKEGALKTSEAVERLSDMMRFMLKENLEDKITLSREIEYLENYISLQSLRVGEDSGTEISTVLNGTGSRLQIAPMLLIPFVENAFKHGLSQQRPSYIRVMLNVENNRLYFEVKNSVHQRNHQDPEAESNGIGLTNVRDRLKLVYPDKHVLRIFQTDSQFQINLELDLS